MKTIPTLILFFLIVSPLTLTAQRHTEEHNLKFLINGIVKDSASKKRLSFATISLYNAVNNNIVGGTLALENGTYSIPIKKSGNYYLLIDFIGYKPIKTMPFKVSSPKLNYQIETVFLVSTGNKLSDFMVKQEGKVYEVKADKKIFKASKSLTAKAGSVLDLLQNVPDLNVDIDGNISLRGSGNVNILIDGKPLLLSASGIKGLLSQMPATNVKDIEVITNPSAKYDPEGMAGIINIVLKKKKSLGFNGNVNLGVGSIPSYNSSLTLNYNKKKWNVYGTIGGRGRNNTFYSRSNRNSSVISVREYMDGNSKRGGYFMKVGADYSLTKTDVFSLNISANNNVHKDIQRLDIFSEQLISNNIAFTDRSVEKESGHSGTSTNFGYDKKYKKKGEKLSILMNYSLSSRRRNEALHSNLFVDSNKLYIGFLKQETSLPRENMNSFIKMDYVLPWGKKSKWEMGLKTIFRSVDNITRSESGDTTSNTLVDDLNINNRFLYNQQVHALYGIFHREFGKKWKSQIGLRGEFVKNESELIETKEKNNKKYYSLYPSAFLTYTINKKANVNMSYSRRVNRPRLRQLNPFTSYTSPITRRSGNPNLNPEYINSYQMGYAKYKRKWNFNADLYYRQLVDRITRTVALDSTGITTVKYNNIDNTESYGTSINYGYRPNKKLSMNINANLNFSKFAGDIEGSGYANSGLSYRVALFTSYKLPKDFAVQTTVFYKSPFPVTQGKIYSFNSVDLALSKKVLRKRGQLTFGVKDVFNTLRFKIDIDGNSFSQNYLRKRQTRELTINFSYNFGAKVKKRHNKHNSKQEGNKEDMGL